MSLQQPSPEITAAALQSGQRVLVAGAAWASMTGGVVLMAIALELGAGPRSIGLLGAIPFIGLYRNKPVQRESIAWYRFISSSPHRLCTRSSSGCTNRWR